MSQRKVTPAERYAIYTVHGEKCYMGHEPLTLRDMQVDHVIPENLLGEPTRLSEVLAALGLPADFKVNSYENWLPTCGRCNNVKRASVFKPSLLMQATLEVSCRKAPEVAALAREMVSDAQISRAVNLMERAVETGSAPHDLRDDIERLFNLIAPHRQVEARGQPFSFSARFVVLSEKNGIRIVDGPYGVGGGPIDPSDAMRCGECGCQFFNGVLCVMCGRRSDSD